MKKILMLAAVVAAASGISSAAQLCASGQGIISTAGPITVTPGQVYTSTFSCQIGNSVFSNFSIVTNSGFPASSSFSLALTVGTTGNTLDFAITESAGEDVRLYYQIDGGVSGMILQAAGSPGSQIIETICSAPLAGTVCPQGTQLANFSAGQGQTASSGSIQVVATDYVFKDIIAGQGISDFTQTITPEPMSLSLMGAGLLGLGILGRRRFKK